MAGSRCASRAASQVAACCGCRGGVGSIGIQERRTKVADNVRRQQGCRRVGVSPKQSTSVVRSLDLGGHRILVTGGLGALGQVITARLLAHGADVGVLDTAPEPPPNVLDAQPELRYRQCDVSDSQAVREAVRQTPEWLGGRPTIVCCHAGIVDDACDVEKFSRDSFDAIQRVNVGGSFSTAQAAAALWREYDEPGHLIFTTSWVSDVPWPGIAPYSASKAAMKSLMRSFARELAPYRIRSNALAPGIVGAGMAKKQWDTDPEYRARVQRAIPLGYLQSPDSVADAMLFLCSDLAAYMSGATLLIDGGASLYPLD
jgi:NAD(P)-dependent dehydrogenase (short-subunit alcohol dehydrogenase family)